MRCSSTASSSNIENTVSNPATVDAAQRRRSVLIHPVAASAEISPKRVVPQRGMM
jgi:hypothetical protein